MRKILFILIFLMVIVIILPVKYIFNHPARCKNIVSGFYIGKAAPASAKTGKHYYTAAKFNNPVNHYFSFFTCEARVNKLI
ncbi:MAG TPA: hypothetical protein VG738_22075 [Chitinophagaceae bacterium]|nr:hypothetical protein [Chitinophagaceae bacterium]